MFNKTYINGYPSSVNVNVTEKRAPTDQSVQLLKEMEEAARKKVIESISVSNTAFECKIHKVRDAASDQYVFFAYYMLNGVRGETEVRINYRDELTIDQMAVRVRDQVAVDIANRMIYTAFVDMLISSKE